MTGSGFVIFLVVVLTVWTGMHAYVVWRLSSLPWFNGRPKKLKLVLAAAVLWALYPLGRILHAGGSGPFAGPVEWIGAGWIGVLFLLLSSLVTAEVVTLPFRRHRLPIRQGAVLVAVALALLAIVQAQRRPNLTSYTVELAGLPVERDGLVVVQISDGHLGSLLGRRWLESLVSQVNALKPDLLVITGDIVDGDASRVRPLLPLLRQLSSPLGVWAVSGNHEYYAGLEESIMLFQEAGWGVLRDRHTNVAPGLVLAGVDDLTARRQLGSRDNPLDTALANRPAGATILLSHSPLQADRAAALGADLMLSGHTHNGQIWPFTHLVALAYPLVGGRYEVSGMPVIVSRGTGTWGPRMRLWRASEIVRIQLRRPASISAAGAPRNRPAK